MNDELLIAKRYAIAYLNIFPIDERDCAQIKKAKSFLDSHKEVFSLLKVPLLDPAIKITALKYYLIEQFSLAASFATLIQLLVNQKRSYLINLVLEQIQILYEDKQGIESFIIASSDMLAPNDIKALEQFLADKTGHTIMSVPTTDATLIAGIRMQSADHLWEYSIKKQLNAIEAQFDK